MSTFSPKVSIIIPVYNGSNYLKEAIDSALAQTYKNIEIIVINDGSTDNGATEKIAKSYGNKIKYYKKENGGVATALNLGIRKMTGEYFSWLSHDDMYYPNKIEKQIKYLSKLNNKKVVLYSNYEVIDENSHHVAFVDNDHNMLTAKPEYALLRGCVNGITLLIPKDALANSSIFNQELKCTQDYDMWMRIMPMYKFVHMDTRLAKTRIHSKQDSANHPMAITEGNELWTRMMDDLSARKKISLEGSEYSFYLKMYLHLKKSEYNKAAQHALEKANKSYEKTKKNSRTSDPLISVIIPCYNQGKFLDEAVNSVLKQTYENFEIIIINDGSTDEYTNDLLRNYKRKNTTVYRTKNQGVTSARNFGVLKSKGNLIQFLDADDYLSSKKFEYQARVFAADPSVDVCYTSYRYYFVKDKKYKPPFHSLVLGGNPFEDFLYKWQRGLSIPIHSAMFRKNIFNESTPFVEGIKGSEDWIMWVDISSRGAHFLYLDDDLATYRVQEKSVTLDGEHMFYWATRAVAYIAEKYIEKASAERYDTAQQHYLKYLAEYLLFDNSKAQKSQSSNLIQTIVPQRVRDTIPYKALKVLVKRGPKVALNTAKTKIRSKQ